MATQRFYHPTTTLSITGDDDLVRLVDKGQVHSGFTCNRALYAIDTCLEEIT